MGNSAIFQSAKVLIFSEHPQKSLHYRRAYARIPMSSFLGHHALSLRSRVRVSAYATSLTDLYAATLCARTILPRKARREPTLENESDAPLFAYEYDTPPAAFAL